MSDRTGHLRLISGARTRNEHRYLETIRWTRPQRSLLEATEPIVVFWGANKIGKTWVMAADVLLFLRGEHPRDQTHRPPVEVCIIGESHEQMQALLQALWRSMDKRDFSDSLRLAGGQIKGQKYPIYDVVDGPGRGGRLHLRTYSAGATRLAGPAYHRVVTDEPMKEDVYNELWPRLASTGGHLRIGFTPTMGTYRHLAYLWQLVDDGEAREIQVPYTLDALTPRGGLVEAPWKTQVEIDAYERGFSRFHRDMRMGRSREPLAVDRVLEGYGKHLVHPCRFVSRREWDRGDPGQIPSGHVTKGGCYVGVGIDHGAKAGRQRAVVVACRPEGHGNRVWVLAEAYQDRRTTPEDDARDIMEALASCGLTVRDVDFWIGDRDHPGDNYAGTKGNRKLLKAFRRVLGVTNSGLPEPLRRLRTPSKWEDSVWEGADMLNELMMADPPLMVIDPRVTQLQDDMASWQGALTAPEKDGIDALRYIVYHLTEGVSRLGGLQ